MPSIFGDNMVLQRNTKVAIYGTTKPEERVSVRVTWNRDTFRTRADSNGNWRVDVPTGDASTGEWVRVEADETKEFKNVCIGEVWICSGQSNMARSLGGQARGPIENGFSVIKQANRPDIRLYQLPRVSASLPAADNPSEWLVSDHETAAAFSAVGYVFGKELNDYLDVPIGLIQNAWGGSNVESWISKAKFASMGITKENNYYMKQSSEISVETRENHEPSNLFNGMLHPLIPYTIRGAIWYQGEANTVNSAEYADLFAGMIEDWRAYWGIGNFPFYFVQIAPYEYPAGRDNSALVREAQSQVADRLFNVGMVSALDAGLENDIHPPYKLPIGERLAAVALANTYEVKGFPKGNPVYETMTIERGRIRLQFKHAGNGLYVEGDSINGLQIAGEDKVFYPAKGQPTPNGQMIVSSDKVANPVAVRYGFTDWVQGNVFNTFGFPLSSFRTDDWDE